MFSSKNKSNQDSNSQSSTLIQRLYQLFAPRIFNSFEVTCSREGQTRLQVQGPAGMYYELKLPDIQALRETGTSDVTVRFRVSEQHDEQVYTLPFRTWLRSAKGLPESIEQAHEAVKQGLTNMGLEVLDALELETEFSAKEIARDNQPDLVFNGRVIASKTAPFRNSRNTVYTVYETDTGKIVAVKTGQSLLPGEHTRNETKVCQYLDEIVELFGFNFTTKEMYAQLGVNAVERI